MKHAVTEAHQPAAPEIVRDLTALINRLQGNREPFVLATVVRTISVTAAKAGAKAVIARDGAIVGGWIGGGCARAAVVKAAREAFEDGETRLISIQPADLLAELGVAPGDEREGVRFAKNMCPSQGTMDIFIEPVLPRPALVVLGASPVAQALALQGPGIGFDVTLAAPAADLDGFHGPARLVDGFALARDEGLETYVVVSTQGRGDLAALTEALKVPARHLAFVGSRRKLDTLKDRLLESGLVPQQLDRIKGPAGLDLGAITPEEIALSILAEILMVRRSDQRKNNIHHV